jgi:hypothetical protein
MSGSLASLLRYTEASAGGAGNDHDAIAQVRSVDVYSVKRRIEELEAENKRLQAIADKLPKTAGGE